MGLHADIKREGPSDILSRRKETWHRKKIIRRLYNKWYGFISGSLRPGKTLELGGGSGNLKELLPEAIASDIVFVPWLDAVLDAHVLPFKEQSLDNIVLFDVLHHLEAPSVFFSEVERVLKSHGRAIMVEPYVSCLSFFVYRFLHQEGMKGSVDPYDIDHLDLEKDPFTGNQAIPTLIFKKYKDKFYSRFPQLNIIHLERMDFLIYPLSGGFSKLNLCPIGLVGFLEFVEKILHPLNDFLAFRVFIVLEKD